MTRLAGFFLWIFVLQAQPITAETVATLGSVQQIDYATAPAEAGDLASGWLRLSADGTRVVTINRTNDLLLWDTRTGDLLDSYRVDGGDGLPATMLDAAFGTDGVVSLHSDGAQHFIARYDLPTGALQVVAYAEDRPVRVWPADDPAFVWAEVLADEPYVVRVDMANGEVMERFASAPEVDENAVVRIGRMPAPLAVTSTEGGEATLWNLETREALSTVQAEAMPMFGHINGAAGRHLVWRDPQSENLYLLDFDAGENTFIAPLGGAYVQALLLGPSSDLVIGVNIDLQPVVVAWDVATGEQIELGPYRACARTPDMVQLSEDGTTLVIGCDTGLDIWQVGGNQR